MSNQVDNDPKSKDLCLEACELVKKNFRCYTVHVGLVLYEVDVLICVVLRLLYVCTELETTELELIASHQYLVW